MADGRSCSFCPQVVRIGGGRFFRGSLPGEGHNDEHGPNDLPFAVQIEGHLAVSVYNIMRREYSAFAFSTGRVSERCNGFIDGVFKHDLELSWRDPGFAQLEDHPVVCVTWDDAQSYVHWLSGLTGKDIVY